MLMYLGGLCFRSVMLLYIAERCRAICHSILVDLKLLSFNTVIHNSFAVLSTARLVSQLHHKLSIQTRFIVPLCVALLCSVIFLINLYGLVSKQ